MKRNKILSLALALILVLGAGAFPAAAETALDVSTLYKAKDVEDEWSPAEAEVIDLNAAEDGLVTITEEGDYVLSGTLEGRVVIEAPEEDKVRLILNGATIVSPEGPAIYEKQADKLIITLAEGTVNTLTDGDMIPDGDDEIGAALYAEDDLSINGSGTLVVNGTRKHGIQSKADLVIAGGEITVSAVTDGIRGRNSLLLLDGSLNITAGGDGLTATRTEEKGKGWVVLSGGSVTVKTGDGAGEVRASANSHGGFGGRGRMDDWGSSSSGTDSGVSRKAVKAATDLTVLGGTYVFDCEDDGLHGANVTVSGGTFSIQSGDDALHADSELTVNAGEIDIAQCYEGLEGENVTVNGGSIRIQASDDGINAAGGSDGSGFGGWGRDGGTAASGSAGILTISGGEISVTAGGDGLDSNGSIRITGGVTGVWAATTTGEGAIDFNGTGTLSGGTLIVASTGGVMRDTSGLSGQSVMAFSVSGSAGETVTLTDGSGTVLGSFTPGNAFDTLMVSSAQLQEGSAFAVTGGSGTLYSGSMTNSLTAAGGGYGGDFGGGFGGGRNKKRGGW